MYLKEEWHVRKIILEAALEILSDGQNYTARQILSKLEQRSIHAPKKLVNSVLFSEGRRYVNYNNSSFFYQLRSVNEIENNQEIFEKITLAENNDTLNVVRAKYIGKNDEFIFTSKKSTSPAFFDVSIKGRTIEISLNENHPFFPDLNELIFTTIKDEKPDNSIIKRRMINLMMAAWAKYEVEQPEGTRKHKAEELRIDWGRNIRDILLSELAKDIE